MKLITFRLRTDEPNTPARFGAIDNDTIIDLYAADERRIAPTLHDYLKSGESIARLQMLVEQAHSDYCYSIDQIVFLPPIPRPDKIICVGQNYTKHIMEMGREIPKFPVIFAKYPNVLIGHEDMIPMPTVSDQLDWEGELAFVIGKRAKNVSEADAYQHIAGYAPFNDVTVRDIQRRTSQFVQGKSFDGSGPMGPALTTADEVPDPLSLDLSVRLNGELMQETSTADMYFKIPFLVQFLSETMTLEPGDIIATGTPDGVGFARDPQVFMKPGDRIEVTIAGLGTLVNTVR